MIHILFDFVSIEIRNKLLVVCMLYLGNITQMNNCHQLAAKTSSPSSSIWQPVSEKQMDRVAIGDTDLSLLFSEMGLGKYTELFKQQEVSRVSDSFSILIHLTNFSNMKIM